MNNNRRRNFRSRPQKNNFRRRSGSINSNGTSALNNNGNLNFNRNGSMNNIHNVEKTMQKYQQLAKDAQSNGDPILAQNYLQHADHFTRVLNERETFKKEKFSDHKSDNSNSPIDEKNDQTEDISKTSLVEGSKNENQL